jgi:hypothetical protein
LDAAGEQGSEPCGSKDEYAANYRPADTQVQPRHDLVCRAIRRVETIRDDKVKDYPEVTSHAIAATGLSRALSARRSADLVVITITKLTISHRITSGVVATVNE